MGILANGIWLFAKGGVIVRRRFYARVSGAVWILETECRISDLSNSIAFYNARRKNGAPAIMLKNVFTRENWFHMYQGTALGVEYIDENSTTTETNFQLNGCQVKVPGQAKNGVFIKERDRVVFCGRPSLLQKNLTICLAYRFHDDSTIHTVNELRDVAMVILCCIVAPVYAISLGTKWPLLFVALCMVYFGALAFWSIYAKRRLLNA
jgi:hypothetical protein